MNAEKQPGSEIAQALVAAQKAMDPAKKQSTNPYFKSKYADLAAVFAAVKGPLNDAGIAVTQSIDVAGSGHVIKTTLLHVSGETLSSTMSLPAVTDPQKLGSAISYYRRYSLMAICGIPSEDDDGNEASHESAKPTRITMQQYENISVLLDGHDDIRKQIVALVPGGILENIEATRYPALVAYINKKLEVDNAKN
jgi:hypothetical protein